MKSHTARFLSPPDDFTNYDRSKVLILPLPFDKTCSWQKGAAKGPDAILDASGTVEFYDIETDSEPFKHGIFTAPPIVKAESADLHLASYEACRTHLQQGKFIISLGGEHSVSYGPIKAHAEMFPDLSILQLDAHTDQRDEYEGTPWSHACIMARAREFTKNIVQVGIRAIDRSEFPNIDRSRLFPAEAIHGRTDWIATALGKLSQHVYLTIDVDVFDTGLIPSTGTPEPGGLGWYEVLALLRQLFRSKNVVGCDVVELAPSPSHRASDFTVAKLVYKIIAYRFQGE